MGDKCTLECEVEGYKFWILNVDTSSDVFYRVTHIQEDEHEIEWIIKLTHNDYDFYSFGYVYTPVRVAYVENQTNTLIPERILKPVIEKECFYLFD